MQDRPLSAGPVWTLAAPVPRPAAEPGPPQPLVTTFWPQQKAPPSGSWDLFLVLTMVQHRNSPVMVHCGPLSHSHQDGRGGNKQPFACFMQEEAPREQLYIVTTMFPIFVQKIMRNEHTHKQ